MIPYIKWKKIENTSIILSIFLLVFSWGEAYKNIEKVAQIVYEDQEAFNKIHTVVSQGNGKILIDDQVFYRLLWFSKDVDRYLLPYDSVFESAVRRPEQFVEYVVLCNECMEDRIFSTHRQQVMNHHLRHFSLVWSNDQYAVFRTKRSESSSFR
jgi:uncharacterized membrane protein